MSVVFNNSDEIAFMAIAIEQARAAAEAGEVPIGAVIVHGGKVIATGRNRKEQDADPTGHAEIEVLRKAGQFFGNWRLLGAELYCTIEPCLMCAGAIVQARIARVVFGCRDPRWGGLRSLHNLLDDPRLNHQIEVGEGICAEACRSLMVEFFHRRRSGELSKKIP